MSVIEKAFALLDALTPAQVHALAPAQRRRLVELCRHWAAVAERPAIPEPKSGVLLALRHGERTL